MEIQELGQDRFLKKDPNQTDQTKDAVYAASNPAPKQGNDQQTKIGRPKGSEEDDGAPNILTGTVIVSCFIQTSALPSRIELQGNDLTFFDDTTDQNGVVVGDTSRLIFTHASAKKANTITQGFIFEKRASVFNTYDNVLSIYALAPATGAHNYLFIGRNATGTDQQRHLHTIRLAIDRDTTEPYQNGSPGVLNGVLAVEYSEDGDNNGARNGLLIGNSEELLGPPFSGLTSVLLSTPGGLCGIGINDANGQPQILLYILSVNAVTVGASMIPDTAGTYDLGSASFPFRDIYATGAVGSAAVSPTLTGIPAMGATSATLAAPWPGSTLTRMAMFSNGDVRLVNFSNGGTSISWSPGLSAAAGSNEVFTYQ